MRENRCASTEKTATYGASEANRPLWKGCSKSAYHQTITQVTPRIQRVPNDRCAKTLNRKIRASPELSTDRSPNPVMARTPRIKRLAEDLAPGNHLKAR